MGLRATLQATCEELRVLRIRRTSANLPVIEFRLRFSVRNLARANCEKLDIALTLQNCPFQLVMREAGAAAGRHDGIHRDTAIPPTLVVHKDVYFEVTVDPGVSRAELIHTILNATCSYRGIGESFTGVERTIRLGDVTTLDWLYHDIEQALSHSSHDDSTNS